MQSVNEIHIVCCNDDVCYGPGEGQNNITDEMRARWERVFKKIEEILEDCGITPDEATLEREDCVLAVILKNSFAFEDALAMLHKLEEVFDLTLFQMDTEYDSWNETNPHVLFGIYER